MPSVTPYKSKQKYFSLDGRVLDIDCILDRFGQINIFMSGDNSGYLLGSSGQRASVHDISVTQQGNYCGTVLISAFIDFIWELPGASVPIELYATNVALGARHFYLKLGFIPSPSDKPEDLHPSPFDHHSVSSMTRLERRWLSVHLDWYRNHASTLKTLSLWKSTLYSCEMRCDAILASHWKRQ